MSLITIMKYNGLNRKNGEALSGIQHLKQSIKDILTTPKGSRVMRPEYGSNLPRLVDLPINKGWLSAFQAEVVNALRRWEPRLTIKQVKVNSFIDGKVLFNIRGIYNEEEIVLDFD